MSTQCRPNVDTMLIKSYWNFVRLGWIFRPTFRSRRDLSRCTLRIRLSQPIHSKTRQNIRVDLIQNPYFAKKMWKLIRLGWFLDQNLGLGVIHRTLPSESQDSRISIPKIAKIRSYIGIFQFVDALSVKIAFGIFDFRTLNFDFLVLVFGFLDFGFGVLVFGFWCLSFDEELPFWWSRIVRPGKIKKCSGQLLFSIFSGNSFKNKQ